MLYNNFSEFTSSLPLGGGKMWVVDRKKRNGILFGLISSGGLLVFCTVLTISNFSELEPVVLLFPILFVVEFLVFFQYVERIRNGVFYHSYSKFIYRGIFKDYEFEPQKVVKVISKNVRGRHGIFYALEFFVRREGKEKKISVSFSTENLREAVLEALPDYGITNIERK